MKDDPNALLIELSTKMTFVLEAINKLEKAMGDRVTSVEQHKLDRSEYNRIQADELKARMDHETRLRNLESARDQWFGKESIVSAFISAAIAVVVAIIEFHR